MTQPRLDFSSPAPFQGRTPRAKHASWTGARLQTPAIWSAKQRLLIVTLATSRPLSRNELAAALQWPLSSVCSVLDALLKADKVESAGEWEIVRWGGRQTRRERFQVRR